VLADFHIMLLALSLTLYALLNVFSLKAVRFRLLAFRFMIIFADF
jgi:hypothetical protein